MLKTRFLSLSLLTFVIACGGGSPKRINGGSKAPDSGPGGGGGAGSEDGEGTGKPPVIGDSIANDPKAADGTDFFPGVSKVAPGKRIFRLTQTQFDQTIKFLFPTIKVDPISQFIAVDPKQTNYDYSDFLLFNSANFTPYGKWIDAIKTQIAANPKAVVNCAEKPPVIACHKEAVAKLVNRAFRGATSQEIVTQYTTLFEQSFTNTGALAEAVPMLVEALLTSPSFAFRAELTADAEGVLSQPEQRQNIAYTLADAPIEELVGTAPLQNLTVDATAVAFASPESKKKLERFFVDWLEIKNPAEMRISKEVFPEFTEAAAQAAVDETKAYLNFYLSQPDPKLSDIVRSRKSFVSKASKAFYASDEGKGDAPEHDAKRRLGIFTQPAFIASRSGPIESNIIKRGVFYMRKVMCLDTGVLPGGLDTTIGNDLGNTERERVEAKTQVAPCLSCHRVINPFGFAFENYDPLGRWRTEEHGYAIDPKVSMEFLGKPELTTQSPIDALDFFTKSDRFKQCFTRQMFRYYMGRNETSSDDPTLKAMFEAIKKDDSVIGALKAMVSSPRMNLRK